jgi:hypothetical protein
MGRSSRHSHRFRQEKPGPKETTPLVPPVSAPAPEVTVQEATSPRGAWIALMIWLTCFLGLSITIWWDFFHGLFFR